MNRSRHQSDKGQPLGPAEHAAMLKAAPPKDRHVMQAQALNQQRYAARDQGEVGSNEVLSTEHGGIIDKNTFTAGVGISSSQNPSGPTRRVPTKGTAGPTYEERVLASKILKICAVRWTSAEARTDQDVSYDMYTHLERKLRRSKQPRVIVVMRNRLVGATLALMLKQFGCSVIFCSDGARAYSKYLKRDADTFSMCICDWDSPAGGVGGRDLSFYEREAGGTLPFVTVAPLYKSFNDYLRQGADLVLRHPIAVHILQLRELLLPSANQFVFPAQLLGTPSNHQHLARLLVSMEKGRDFESESLLQQALDQLRGDAELSDHNKGAKMLDQLVEMLRKKGVYWSSAEDEGATSPSSTSSPLAVDSAAYRNMVNAFRAMLVTFGIMKDDLLHKSEELRLMREYRRRKELGNAYTAAVNAAAEAVAKQQLCAGSSSAGGGEVSATSSSSNLRRVGSVSSQTANNTAAATAPATPNTLTIGGNAAALSRVPSSSGLFPRGAPAFVAIGGQAAPSSAGGAPPLASSQSSITGTGGFNLPIITTTGSFSSGRPNAADLNNLPPLPPLTAESLARMYEPGAFNPYAFIDIETLAKRDITTLIRKFRNRIAELEAENELTVRELERFAFFKVELEDNLATNNIAIRFEEVNYNYPSYNYLLGSSDGLTSPLGSSMRGGVGAAGGARARSTVYHGGGGLSMGRQFKGGNGTSGNPLFTRTGSSVSYAGSSAAGEDNEDGQGGAKRKKNGATSSPSASANATLSGLAAAAALGNLNLTGPYASLQQSVAALVAERIATGGGRGGIGSRPTRAHSAASTSSSSSSSSSGKNVRKTKGRGFVEKKGGRDDGLLSTDDDDSSSSSSSDNSSTASSSTSASSIVGRESKKGSPRDPFDVPPSVWENRNKKSSSSTKDVSEKKKKKSNDSNENSKQSEKENKKNNKKGGDEKERKSGSTTTSTKKKKKSREDKEPQTPTRRKSVAAEGIDILKNRSPGETKTDRIRNLTRKSIAGIQQMKALQGFGVGDGRRERRGLDNTREVTGPLGVGGVPRSPSFLLRQQQARMAKERRGLFARRPNGIAENYAEYGRRMEEARMVLEDPYAQAAIKNGDPTGVKYFKPLGGGGLSLGISSIPMIGGGLSGIGIGGFSAVQPPPPPSLSPTPSKRGSIFGGNSSIASSAMHPTGLSSSPSGVNFGWGGNGGGAAGSNQSNSSVAFFSPTPTPPPSAAPSNPRTEPLDKYHMSVVEFVNSVATECNKTMAKLVAAQPNLRLTLEELSATIRDKIKQLDAIKKHKEAAAALTKASGAHGSGVGSSADARLQEQLILARQENDRLKGSHPDVELRKRLAQMRQKFFTGQQRSARAIAHRAQIIAGLIYFFKWKQYAMQKRVKTQELSIRAAAKRDMFENKGTFIGQLNLELADRNEEIKSLKNLLKSEAKIREAVDVANRSLQAKLDAMTKAANNLATSSSMSIAANHSIANALANNAREASYSRATSRANVSGMDSTADMYSSGAPKKKTSSNGDATKNATNGVGGDHKRSESGGAVTPSSRSISPAGTQTLGRQPSRVLKPSGKGRGGNDIVNNHGPKNGSNSPTSPSRVGRGNKANNNNNGRKGKGDVVGSGGVPLSSTRDWLSQVELAETASTVGSNYQPSHHQLSRESSAVNLRQQANGASSPTVVVESGAEPSDTVLPAQPLGGLGLLHGGKSSAASGSHLSDPRAITTDPLERTSAPVQHGAAVAGISRRPASSLAPTPPPTPPKKKSVKLSVPTEKEDNTFSIDEEEEDHGGSDGQKTQRRSRAASGLSTATAEPSVSAVFGSSGTSTATPRGTAAVVVSHTYVGKDASSVTVPVTPRLSIVASVSEVHGVTSPAARGLTSPNMVSLVLSDKGAVGALGVIDDDTDPLGSVSHNGPLSSIANAPTLEGHDLNSVGGSEYEDDFVVDTEDAFESPSSRQQQNNKAPRPITPRSAETDVLLAELRRRGYEISSGNFVSGAAHPKPSPPLDVVRTYRRPQRVHSAPAHGGLDDASSTMRAQSPLLLSKGPLLVRRGGEKSPTGSVENTAGATSSLGHPSPTSSPSHLISRSAAPTPTSLVAAKVADLIPIADRGPLPLPGALLPDVLRISLLPNTADEGQGISGQIPAGGKRGIAERELQAVSIRDERPASEVVIKKPKSIATQTLISFRALPLSQQVISVSSASNNSAVHRIHENTSYVMMTAMGDDRDGDVAPPHVATDKQVDAAQPNTVMGTVNGSSAGNNKNKTNAEPTTTTTNKSRIRNFSLEALGNVPNPLDPLRIGDDKMAQHRQMIAAASRGIAARKGGYFLEVDDADDNARNYEEQKEEFARGERRQQAERGEGGKPSTDQKRDALVVIAPAASSGLPKGQALTFGSVGIGGVGEDNTYTCTHQTDQSSSSTTALPLHNPRPQQFKPQKVVPQHYRLQSEEHGGLIITGTRKGAATTTSTTVGGKNKGEADMDGAPTVAFVASGLPIVIREGDAIGASAGPSATTSTSPRVVSASPARGAGAQAAAVADALRSTMTSIFDFQSKRVSTSGQEGLRQQQHASSSSVAPTVSGNVSPGSSSLARGGAAFASISPVVAANLKQATAKAMADIEHSIRRLEDATGVLVPINVPLLQHIANQVGGGGGDATVTAEQRAAFQIVSEMQRALHLAAVAASRDKQSQQLTSRRRRALERLEEEKRARELRFKLDEGYLRTLKERGATVGRGLRGHDHTRNSLYKLAPPPPPALGGTSTFEDGSDPFEQAAQYGNAFFTFTLSRPTKMQLALSSMMSGGNSYMYAATQQGRTALSRPSLFNNNNAVNTASIVNQLFSNSAPTTQHAATSTLFAAPSSESVDRRGARRGRGFSVTVSPFSNGEKRSAASGFRSPFFGNYNGNEANALLHGTAPASRRRSSVMRNTYSHRHENADLGGAAVLSLSVPTNAFATAGGYLPQPPKTRNTQSPSAAPAPVDRRGAPNEELKRRYPSPPRSGGGVPLGVGLLPDMSYAYHAQAQNYQSAARRERQGKEWTSATEAPHLNTLSFTSSPLKKRNEKSIIKKAAGGQTSQSLNPEGAQKTGGERCMPKKVTTSTSVPVPAAPPASYDRSGRFNLSAKPFIVQEVTKALATEERKRSEVPAQHPVAQSSSTNSLPLLSSPRRTQTEIRSDAPLTARPQLSASLPSLPIAPISPSAAAASARRPSAVTRGASGTAAKKNDALLPFKLFKDLVQQRGEAGGK